MTRQELELLLTVARVLRAIRRDAIRSGDTNAQLDFDDLDEVLRRFDAARDAEPVNQAAT